MFDRAYPEHGKLLLPTPFFGITPILWSEDIAGITLFLTILATHVSVWCWSTPVILPLSSTPMSIVPPLELANATISLARLSGRTSELLNSTALFSPCSINCLICSIWVIDIFDQDWISAMKSLYPSRSQPGRTSRGLGKHVWANFYFY